MPLKPSSPEAYLASLEPEKRATLERVRKAIRAAAPDAEEGMRYGMPAFIRGKPIAGYAASARHCAYYPMSGSVVDALQAELEAYETSKGAIRFPIGKPPPAPLIRKLVKARLAEIGAAPAAQQARARTRAAKTAPSRERRQPAREPAAEPARKRGARVSAERPDVTAVLHELRRNASKQYRADMAARYGIVTQAPVYGTPMAQLKLIAKRLGRDHALAGALWQSGVHDARMLATLLVEPERITRAQMARWARGFDNWALVDTACFNAFDRAPQAFEQIEAWAVVDNEHVKRAAFALLACAALHGRGKDEDHLRGLELLRDAAGDSRNFVKKSVSWALRAIGGKQSPTLRRAARALARELAASSDATRRWIGKDALRAFAKS